VLRTMITDTPFEQKWVLQGASAACGAGPAGKMALYQERA